MPLRGRSNLTDESIFFVTTTVNNFQKVFSIEECCNVLINNIKHYQKRYNFSILAYVIMPHHFHWIVIVDTKKGTISDVMRDIKKYSAWDILDIIEKENLSMYRKFSNPKVFGQKRQLWMHRFDDKVVRTQSMFELQVEYIHNNPVKSGLVAKPADYKYSSARNYYDNDHSVIEVDTGFFRLQHP
ncbi:MAG: transposase [Bacteroidetes bacterium]|nr:transposase [Bacteroidota bacterium]